MIPVVIFISCLYDSFNEVVRGGGGSKFWRAKPASVTFISLSDYPAGQYQGWHVDVHEVASLVMFWGKHSLINTLICGGCLGTDAHAKPGSGQTEPLLLDRKIDPGTESVEDVTKSRPESALSRRDCSNSCCLPVTGVWRCKVCSVEIQWYLAGRSRVLYPLHSTSKPKTPPPPTPEHSHTSIGYLVSALMRGLTPPARWRYEMHDAPVKHLLNALFKS